MHLPIVIRSLVRTPWATGTAASLIALTVSLGATVFALVDGVLFKSLPYPEPSHLYSLVGADRTGDTAALSWPDIKYLEVLQPTIILSAIGARPPIVDPARPDIRLAVAAVDERFFHVLQVYPAIGGFAAEDFIRPMPPGVLTVLLSQPLWRQWLNSDPHPVGRTVVIGGNRLIVAGILPPDFIFPIGAMQSQILTPLVPSSASLTDRWRRSLSAVARMDGALPIDDAKARLDSVIRLHESDYRPQSTTPGPYVAVRLRPLEVSLGQQVRRPFSVVFIAALVLIALGAANTVGAFAQRVQARRNELRVRIALGASIPSIVGLLVSEGLILAIAGCAIALMITTPLVHLAAGLLPTSLPLLKEPAVDRRVVVFALLSSIVPVVAVALVVARRITVGIASSPIERVGVAPIVAAWPKYAILATQSALGMVLVIAATVVISGYLSLRTDYLGFDPSSLAIFECELPGGLTPLEREKQSAQLYGAVQAFPRVQLMATVGVPILEDTLPGSRLKPLGGNEGRTGVNEIPVSGAFFEVTGLRVLQGRAPGADELRTLPPIAVVSKAAALRLWPDGQAIGRQLRREGTLLTVVGIVEDAQFAAPGQPVLGEIYVASNLRTATKTVFLLKMAGSPAISIADLARTIARDVPMAVTRRALTLDQLLSDVTKAERLTAVGLGLAAGAGMIILAVCMFGLVADAVSRRQKEIGIRAAMGAEPRALTNMILFDYLRPCAAGIMAGVLVAWWSSRSIRHLPFQASIHDVSVWVVAVVILLTIAMAAAWFPARRAALASPADILRGA